MIEIATIVIGYILAIVVGEIVQRGSKMHTKFIGILLAHMTVGLAVYFFLLFFTKRISLITILIFWMGAFLSWFCIRGHIECSILVLMLYLLKINGPMSPDELCALYETHYGAKLRIEELVKGGLITYHKEGFVVSRKGRLIVKIFSVITYLWTEDKVLYKKTFLRCNNIQE